MSCADLFCGEALFFLEMSLLEYPSIPIPVVRVHVFFFATLCRCIAVEEWALGGFKTVSEVHMSLVQFFEKISESSQGSYSKPPGGKKHQKSTS